MVNVEDDDDGEEASDVATGGEGVGDHAGADVENEVDAFANPRFEVPVDDVFVDVDALRANDVSGPPARSASSSRSFRANSLSTGTTNGTRPLVGDPCHRVLGV